MDVKKYLAFPTPYTILMIVIVIAAGATWVLPSGNYDKLSYDSSAKNFILNTSDGVEILPPTQKTLENLGIKVKLEKITGVYKDGKLVKDPEVYKPIAVPGTYTEKPSNPQKIGSILKAPIEGIYEAKDVILFVLILGGFIGVFNKSGAFDIGMRYLAKRLRGRESWLIIIVTTLMAAGGTTFGLAEETIAFYPILVPVFLAAGYDVMVPLAVIYVGSGIGFMSSTSNPFATVIASESAGINWASELGLASRIIMLLVSTIICIIWILRYAKKVKADPSKSILAGTFEGKNLSYPITLNTEEKTTFDTKTKLLLFLFAFTFIFMIFGVSVYHWYFVEMTVIFMVAAVVIGIFQGLSEKDFIKSFIDGAKDLLGVAFIIGIARGVTVILDSGLVSDTILFYSASSVQGMSSYVFIIALMFVYIGLTIFIPSSSGMAVLTMPIIGGLAEVAGVPREMIVNAYLFGMGIMGFLTPAGLILPSLAMVDVNYDTWLKFIMPLVGILIVLSAISLSVGVMMA